MGKDLWENIKGQVSKFAPVLASAIVPGGGAAVSFIASALGVANEPEAISNALNNASSADIAKLREIETKHEEALAAIGLEQDKAYLADRADARDMHKAGLQSDNKLGQEFVYYFGFFIVAFSFIYITAITFIPIPPDNVRFVDIVLGFMLGTLVATVVGFFFGSSDGSKKKTQIMSVKDSIVAGIKDKVQGRS